MILKFMLLFQQPYGITNLRQLDYYQNHQKLTLIQNHLVHGLNGM